MDRAFRWFVLVCWLLLAPWLGWAGWRVEEMWGVRWGFDTAVALGRLMRQPLTLVVWPALLGVGCLPFWIESPRSTFLRLLPLAFLLAALALAAAQGMALALHPQAAAVLWLQFLALVATMLAFVAWCAMTSEVDALPRAESLHLEALRSLMIAVPPAVLLGPLLGWLASTSGVRFPLLVAPLPIAAGALGLGLPFLVVLWLRTRGPAPDPEQGT